MVVIRVFLFLLLYVILECFFSGFVIVWVVCCVVVVDVCSFCLI